MKVTIVLNKENEDSVQSVKDQVHPDWDLVIDDSMPTNLLGDFVVYMCAGDKLLPNHLNALLEQFEEGIDVVYGTLKEFKYQNPERFSVYKKLSENFPSQVMIRKSALDSCEWQTLAELFSQLESRQVSIQVAERCYPKEVIDHWEAKRNLRYRRQMKISVVFGIRDRARYAKRVLRSLLVQDLHRDMYDIIVVDFGSSDDISNYVNMLKSKNVKFVSVPDANQYDRARALNIGLKHSKGDIILFSETDLLLPKYALRLLKDHFIEHQNEVVLLKQRDLEKLETAVVIGKTYSDYAAMLQKIKAKEAKEVGCFAVERVHAQAIGGFDESYTKESYEVQDFLDRIEKHGLTPTISDVEALHMWHSEPEKSEYGYFKELYERNKLLDTNVRNEGREWGTAIKKRPKVLFMLSPDIWECGTICKYVAQFIAPDYEVDVVGLRKEIRGKTSKKYDIVYSCDWRYPVEFRAESSKFVLGINDFVSWNDGTEYDQPQKEILERLKMFEAVGVPCKRLGEIFIEHHPDTHYIPSAVDTEFFKPLKEKRRVSKKFTVGWVGKPEKKHTIEGYQEHIKPVCNQIDGVELFSAPGGEDINGHLQMLGFYNAVDVLVVFAETGGDNKTILEAMACGIPVITTRVADVDEIVENGLNGLVIPHNEYDLEQAIMMLRDKKEMRLRMGAAARISVVKKWDWRDKIHHWREFFDSIMRED